MARLKSDPICLVDLEEYLRTDSDFAFELLVLRLLREAGVECEHAGLYEDPVTKKSREFDIRATRTLGEHRVRIAIECKNVRDSFPLLVSCIPRHIDEAYHCAALVSEPERNRSDMLAGLTQSRARVLKVTGAASVYAPGAPVGKSIAQVGRALDGSLVVNDSDVYEKWGQCLSSADDLVGRMYWDGHDEGKAYLSIVLPFVVVPDSRLWMVEFDVDGNLRGPPVLTDRCSSYVGKSYLVGSNVAGDTFKVSHVELMTYTGLRQFIGDVLQSQETVAQLFPKDALADSYRAAVRAEI